MGYPCYQRVLCSRPPANIRHLNVETGDTASFTLAPQKNAHCREESVSALQAVEAGERSVELSRCKRVVGDSAAPHSDEYVGG